MQLSSQRRLWWRKKLKEMSPVQVSILILVLIDVTIPAKCFHDPLGLYVTALDQNTSESGDMKSEVVAPTIPHHAETLREEEDQADLPLTQISEKNPEAADPEPETSQITTDPPASCADDQPPTSPMMDLENDFPPSEM